MRRSATSSSRTQLQAKGKVTRGRIGVAVQPVTRDWFNVDVDVEEAKPEDHDALLLPGGVANPDPLRTSPDAVQLGGTLSSWRSLKTDLTTTLRPAQGGAMCVRKIPV